MWLNRLKIAIVEKNTNEIDKLLDEVPEFSNKKAMQEAMYLMREASELLYSLKDETGEILSQIKKNIDFLNSTQTPTYQTKIDIKS
ncbi:MAG: hypothetical protein L3I99_06560 [Sulfurimonas sp.]|nr:hypothetical protein [Sulfurimonas sp.]